MSSEFDLANPILSNLYLKPLPSLKRTAMPIKSLSYIALINLELLELGASTSTTTPSLPFLDAV
jgi:hypothetical protein